MLALVAEARLGRLAVRASRREETYRRRSGVRPGFVLEPEAAAV